jgi:hypothetical protein
MKLNQRETKMANITVSDLRPAGADLFSDSESYLSDLNDHELYHVNGGWTTPLTTITSSGPFCATLVVGVVATVVLYQASKR